MRNENRKKLDQAEIDRLVGLCLAEAEEAKKRRPSVVFVNRMAEALSSRPVRYAIPALCCALALAFGIWQFAALPDFQSYHSAEIPIVEVVRGESTAPWKHDGWLLDSLNGLSLKTRTFAPAATASSSEAVWQMTALYEKNVRLTVSEAPLPLWAVLSREEPYVVSGVPVYLGKDENVKYAAVWQTNEGLTVSLEAGSARELLKLLRQVLK